MEASDDEFLRFVRLIRSCEFSAVEDLLGRLGCRTPDELIDKSSSDDAMSVVVRLGHASALDFLFELGASRCGVDSKGRTLAMRALMYAKRLSFVKSDGKLSILDGFVPCLPSEMMDVMFQNGVSFHPDDAGVSPLSVSLSWGLHDLSFKIEGFLLGKTGSGTNRSGL